LVGTGPYELQSIEADGSRTFVANEDYWRTPAQIKTIRYQWVSDSVTLGTGMLGGPGIRQYDVGGGSTEQWQSFRDDPTLTFEEDVTGTVYFYAGMNTEEIPLHHRKAMAYALNYTYIIEDWFEGRYLYMTTPVTPGIPYAKTDCDAPYQDYSIARNFLIQAGDSGGLDASAVDQDWIDLAEGASPIAAYNVSYREGSATWGAIV
jgi:ABC-type transport system substrate-binding protein